MALALIFVLSLVGGWLFPWWWPALLGYVLGFWLGRPSALSRRPLKNGASAFAAGFLGTGMAWLALAAFMDWRNHHLLSARMAVVFHLPTHWALLVLTALLGGLLGGVAAWAGHAVRTWLTLRRRAEGLGSV